MKWLADQNISKNAIAYLRGQGGEVLSVAELTRGIDDAQLIQRAVAHQCILLSFDRDLGNLIFGQNSTPPPAVVYLRVCPQTLDGVFRAGAGMNCRHCPRTAYSGRVRARGHAKR